MKTKTKMKTRTNKRKLPLLLLCGNRARADRRTDRQTSRVKWRLRSPPSDGRDTLARAETKPAHFLLFEATFYHPAPTFYLSELRAPAPAATGAS